MDFNSYIVLYSANQHHVHVGYVEHASTDLVLFDHT